MRVNVKEGSGNHFYSTPASETTIVHFMAAEWFISDVKDSEF